MALESCDFRELVGSRRHQRYVAFFRQHQQQILIGQQHKLAIAVTPAFPFPLAVFNVDARQNVAVETVSVAFVNGEVVEIRLQPV
jgi:hypothetical protein